MPASFNMSQHGPRKLRVSTFCGMVFGTLSPDASEFEAWLGPEIVARVRRVLGNRRLEVIGRFTQALPNNWKLYFENVRDTYHASLLHLFFATFRITRLSSGGGVLVSETGEHHASATLAPMQGKDASYQGMRSEKESFRLADPTLLGMRDEFHDDIQLQILSIFPGFVLQQVHNALAVRQIVPRGVDATDLNWTYLGFADDGPELRAHRLKQNNLVGPAGFVSMEDGAVGGFVQRGIAAASEELSVVEMGGSGAETQETRATEASVRGFWKAYRTHMAL
jgi:phenylpropionate dioxygenase-like ring-hydroxylating dioxygenase large terminal subunit